MPNLVIFAGPNGSGKTTLYHEIKNTKNIDFGVRVNPDEIISENKWDWRSLNHLVASGRIAKEKMINCLNTLSSCNWETTTISNLMLKVINIAKENGYNVAVYLVNVDSFDECLKRIQHRVKHGGHGVGRQMVYDRFLIRFKNIDKLIEEVDDLYLVDNSKKLKFVGHFQNGNTVYLDDSCTWINNISAILQKNKDY